MGDKEAVSKNAYRDMHFGLLSDNKRLENHVVEVLGVLSMQHNHACVQEMRHFNGIRLDGKRRVDAAGKEGAHNGEASADPSGEHL